MKASETTVERSTDALSKPLTVERAFAREPDMCSEGGKLAAWFVEPAGTVLQLTDATVFTKEMAEWMVGPAFSTLTQHYPRGTELRLLLDLRPMTAREPAARPVVMGAATRHIFMFAKLGVIAPAKPPPLYMTTLYGAIALLSAIGPEIRIYETLEGALQNMGLNAAQ